MKLARERKLTIEIQKSDFSAQGGSASGGKIPIVWCEAKQITHVISNLLDNAVYYTEKGGVAVSYELAGEDKEFLQVNIKDTGAGISEEDKQKLFQKFSRGSHATNLRPDGSGLGLYIAKKIVEGGGGKIWVESPARNAAHPPATMQQLRAGGVAGGAGDGKGSTFSFTVPIYKNQQTEYKEQRISRENKIEIF
ncbi:hypothetical protein COT99_04085 [Candidatus Falkowbacteria bacterium CG10_big_fil_rev_8_21_14_0_10_43_10]|uniref:histidine kinase n=1 Tax=Candidatus Falkowbacteria bacterium CG10_big_fil_rev_8_21_14_0_10_43_10 TaxID=1974567 RepID=A0A2H0V176_9BACT|nr:MAG: hypothetical protein COT99_04085 [Candidatus Falkowbacteria bacterium CG10_big_fil_rev_8_21_14_0_10_43_10]